MKGPHMKENKHLEFKEQISNSFLKTVSAFANYDGGSVIFGVDDDGRTVGIENPIQACLDIENNINDTISPQPDYELKIDDKKYTVELIVHPGSDTPYWYKSKTYKRNDTSTIEVDNLEMKRLALRGLNINYEETSSDNQDLSFAYLEQQLIDKTGIAACDINILKTLNLYSDKDGYNIAAELLSDNNFRLSIDACKFGENTGIIQKRLQLKDASILSLFESACDMYRDYYQQEEIISMKRTRVDRVPEEAFREGLANALLHRTWDVPTPVRVAMENEKIEIISPGGLPAGVTEENFLSNYFSELRNPIIANVFYRLNIVELYGTGVKKIKESYKKSISQPEFEINENYIKIILPVVKTANNLSDDEAKVYDRLSKNNAKSISEIVEYLDFGKSKTRLILSDLVDKKYVYMDGNGRGTKYYK